MRREKNEVYVFCWGWFSLFYSCVCVEHKGSLATITIYTGKTHSIVMYDLICIQPEPSLSLTPEKNNNNNNNNNNTSLTRLQTDCSVHR
jgi:hypothetical protein